MEEDNKLQRRSNALIASTKQSGKASRETIAFQMKLTAQDAKTQPTPELIAEFDRVFGQESPEATDWVWPLWRDKSKYWPAICDIRALYTDWHRGQREQAELWALQADKAKTEELRRRGELVEFADVMKGLKGVAKAMPEPEHSRRERELRQREVNAEVPSIDSAWRKMSPEQKESRAAKEREEIERYRSDQEGDEGPEEP